VKGNFESTRDTLQDARGMRDERRNWRFLPLSVLAVFICILKYGFGFLVLSFRFSRYRRRATSQGLGAGNGNFGENSFFVVQGDKKKGETGNEHDKFCGQKYFDKA